MQPVFTRIIDALNQSDAYRQAVARFNTDEALIATLNNPHSVDDGSVLDSSLQNPKLFMGVTDILMDYLNNNLDTQVDVDKMLSVLLETEVVAAERFVPVYHVCPSSGVAHSVSYSGTGLVLGFFVSDPIDESLDIETMVDTITSDETPVTYAGSITLYDTGVVAWTPYNNSEQIAEPVLPGEINVFVPREVAGEAVGDGI